MAEFSASIAPHYVYGIDRDYPFKVISGMHAGCFEVYAKRQSGVQSLADLKGRRIAVFNDDQYAPQRLFLATAAAAIGIDLTSDIEWVESKAPEWRAMLDSGAVDAIPVFPPANYLLRGSEHARVIFSTTTDKPWRQYFCCMVAASNAYAEQYPIATRSALRAVLKANALCSSDPQGTAQYLVDNKFAPNYEAALNTLLETDYGAWRDYDPEDTMRFFALRLKEAGLIEKSPGDILTRGTDWRFIEQVASELKG